MSHALTAHFLLRYLHTTSVTNDSFITDTLVLTAMALIILDWTKDALAEQAVMKSGNYAFAGRKMKKRDFRSLWITRISAAAKMNGMNYSTLMHGLKKAGINLNRKMLSEIAIADAEAFASICAQAKAAL